MASLYRKYRPQKFDDLIGQNHIKITLQNEIELDQIGHAYLFCGPRGLGKTTTARLFAKSINCLNRKSGRSEPCNECFSCQSIIDSSSVDIIEIDAASHTGVDNVRENIIENSRFTPSSSKFKVFIIDEVHMLSISAFNALLKTLEEPPAHAIFILCTTEIHKLPQTIISRCQRFDFKKVSSENMIKRLSYLVKEEKKKVAEKVLQNVVLHSEGYVRDAESLLEKILTLGDDITEEQAELVLPRSDFNHIIDLLNFLLDRNTTGAIELINHLVSDGIDLSVFTENLVEFLRKILLLKVNGDISGCGLELDEETQISAEKLAERFDYPKLMSVIELFLQARQELKFAPVPQFPLEMAAVLMCEEVVCKHDDSDDPGCSGSKSEELVKEKIFPKKEAEKKVAKEEVSESNEQEIKPEAIKKELPTEKSNVDFDKIVEGWNSISEKLLQTNYTLSSLLKISRPVKIRNNHLEIGVKSKFYQERLENTNNKVIIEQAISDVTSFNISIRGLVMEDVKPVEIAEEIKEEVLAPPKTGDAASDVIGMF